MQCIVLKGQLHCRGAQMASVIFHTANNETKIKRSIIGHISLKIMNLFHWKNYIHLFSKGALAHSRYVAHVL